MSKITAENFESNVDYTTVLQGFEGPLDLLLYLIKCNQIEIKDIFVSQVIEQFMAYLKGLPYLDADKASEYLVIAATILSIKAKSLVPDEEEELSDDDGGWMDDDTEDEKTQLIRALEEYRLIKEETPKLKEMETVGYFYKKPDKGVGKTKIVYTDFTLEKLVQAYREMMLRIETERDDDEEIKEIPKDTFTVADKVQIIRSYLSEKESALFEDLLMRPFNKVEVITTFQALLELLKHQYICVKQTSVFDAIRITLNPDRNEEEDFGEIDEYN